MPIVRLIASLLLIVAPLQAVFAKDAAKSQFDFNPKPAIWKLADEDTTIYLFGTIHALPRELKWRSAKFDQLVKDVDALVVESSDQDIAEGEMTNVMLEEMIKGFDREPLIDRIKPENRETFEAMAKYIGQPISMLNVMPTWIIPFTIYFAEIEKPEIAKDYGHKFGVETVLEAEFKKMEKPVLSIEDAGAVLRAINSMPEAEQLASVDKMLDLLREEGFGSIAQTEPPSAGDKADKDNADATTGDAKEAQTSTILDHSEDIAWAKGQYEKLEEGLTQDELGEHFYKALITDRNAAWTDWLQKRLDKPGKIMVAVGAGHLVGTDSLQNMLAKRDLIVERIQ